MTLVRAPHHVATPIAIVANHCFQLDALLSWLGSHSSLNPRKQSDWSARKSKHSVTTVRYNTKCCLPDQ